MYEANIQRMYVIVYSYVVTKSLCCKVLYFLKFQKRLNCKQLNYVHVCTCIAT